MLKNHGRSGRIRLLAIAGLLAMAGVAGAVDPKAIEDEIRDRMLSGAASDTHLLNAPPERFAAWKAGADAGDPACLWLVGRCVHFGLGVPADPAGATAWYRRAADRGYARAQLSLGLATAAGRDVPKDLEEAFRLYEKAADQPDCPEAHEWLILAYNRGYGVPKDPEKARALGPRAVAAYRALADRGYAGARMRLARILTTGTWGTPIDLEEGLALYRRGAEQGHVYCQTNLGDAYVNGLYGLPRDPARGVKLIRQAADRGEPGARATLAEMYLDGTIPDPDPAEADRLYRAAAVAFRAGAATDRNAAYRLAQMAERGAGMPRDDAEAVALYRRAADAGSAPAALALADRLDAGRGLAKDPEEATRLRERAKAKPSP